MGRDGNGREGGVDNGRRGRCWEEGVCVCVCVWRLAFSNITYDLSLYINTHYVMSVVSLTLRPTTDLRLFFIAVCCWPKYPPVTEIHL